jgi:hypothetical protein
MRVLVADGLADEGLRRLSAAGEVVVRAGVPVEVTREIAQADGIITAVRTTQLPSA